VARAEDGGWIEWLEKMSGPGPFWGFGGYARVYCVNKDHEGVWFCWRPQENARPEHERHILEIGAGYFKTFDGKPRFYDTPNDTRRIQMVRLEGRYYYRFHKALDAGVGFGMRRYSGDDNSGDFTPFTRWNVTPASIVFVPLALAQRDDQPINPWLRLVKLHLEETYIGGISGADFKSASNYKTKGEFLGSLAVEFDLLVFLKGYQGAKK